MAIGIIDREIARLWNQDPNGVIETAAFLGQPEGNEVPWTIRSPAFATFARPARSTISSPYGIGRFVLGSNIAFSSR
jgi:hypothetical protein